MRIAVATYSKNSRIIIGTVLYNNSTASMHPVSQARTPAEWPTFPEAQYGLSRRLFSAFQECCLCKHFFYPHHPGETA
jgi:hypothetical protein